jgi:CDP-diacylglycerol--glycerol-3-phosphate 3-phosphatidyltransferase
MNLPNKLTISRIVLTFVFMHFLLSPGPLAKSAAILVFILASLTDYYDGSLARKKNLITNFGKLMDPIADKVLVLASFLAFVELRLMPAWMMIIILSRELLITGIRLLASTSGVILAAAREGKHKTISQLSSILFILFSILLREMGTKIGFWTGSWELQFRRIIFYLLLIATTLTLISGISFLYRNRRLILVG